MMIRIITTLFFLTFSFNSLANLNILIFYPYSDSASQLEKKLNEVVSNKNIKISLYSRIEDFLSSVKSEKQSILISPSCYSLEKSNFSPIGALVRQGSHKHRVSFYSDRIKKLSPKKKYNIGLLQTCSLNKNYDFAKKLAKLKFKRVKSVPNIEEIPNMLIFEIVDLIAIRNDLIKKITDDSGLTLTKVSTSNPILNLSIYSKSSHTKLAKSAKDSIFRIMMELGGEGIKWLK